MMKNVTTVNNITSERQKLLAALESGTFQTVTALCEAAGVTRNVYYDAIQNDDFVAQLFQSSTGIIYASIPHIMQKIVKQAKGGSFVHQKMLLEMVKLYQGDKPQVLVQNNTYNMPSMEQVKEDWLTIGRAHPEWMEEL